MSSFTRFWKSFKYAAEGIKTAFEEEPKIKIHLACALTVICISAALRFNIVEWIITIFCIGLILALELINSSIEKLADFTTKEIHPEIKKIKDIAAGAVLIGAITVALIWILLLIPHFHQYI